jgi:hypothetical protein
MNKIFALLLFCSTAVAGPPVTWGPGCASGIFNLPLNACLSTGGGGSPGGSSGTVQYNNSGAFGGFGSWDGSTLTVPGDLITNGTGNVSIGGRLYFGAIPTGPTIYSSNGSDLVTGSGNILDDSAGNAQFAGWSFNADVLADIAGTIQSENLWLNGYSGVANLGVSASSAGQTYIEFVQTNPNSSDKFFVISNTVGGTPVISFNSDGSGYVGGSSNTVTWDALGNWTFANAGVVNLNDSNISGSRSITFSGGTGQIAGAGNNGVGLFDGVGNPIVSTSYLSGVQGLGFFNTTPVPQQSGDVATALSNYGLVTSPIVNSSVTMTSNTTATATFNTSKNDETIYDTSTTLITALTIALPSTTRVGQTLRYVSNRTVTTTTVTGTVTVGASPTLAQNTAIAYQAINTTGSFIRIQ